VTFSAKEKGEGRGKNGGSRFSMKGGEGMNGFDLIQTGRKVLNLMGIGREEGEALLTLWDPGKLTIYADGGGEDVTNM